MTPLTFAAPLCWWEVNTTLHRHELKASFWTTAGAVTKEDRSKDRYQFNSSATQFTEEWNCAGRSKELIAWVLREVFRQSAWCPAANPQSRSSPFQQGKIQKGQIQNCVRTFLPGGGETVAEQYTTEVLTMHCNILSPLPVCTCVCASPSPLAPSATLQLPPESSLSLHSLTSGPSSSELALVLSLMPAPFSLSESKLVLTQNRGRREQSVGWCHQNAASVLWPWFSNAYACQLMCCLSTGLSKRHFL